MPMNFGETLAYWYLRFNGFFPLPNFVLHRHEETIRDSADMDILALRHPLVFEVIGGQEADWDSERFMQWGIDLSTQTVGLIVEVKTGRNSREYRANIQQSFDLGRLIYGVQRLGFWTHDMSAVIANELFNAAIHIDTESHFTVGKLLVALNMPRDDQIPLCLKLTLEEAEDFILRRLSKYKEKGSDRLRFPNDLMQYLTWSRRVNKKLKRNSNAT